MNNPVRIAHMITTLEQGGAESMLFKLAGETAKDSRYQQMVISLTGMGVFGPLLAEQGVYVHSVDLRARCSDLFKIVVLIKKIRAFRPRVLQTWLYHADLLGTLILRFAGGAKLVWNIRCSDMDLKEYAWTTNFIFRILQKLSFIPSMVCSNSQAGIRVHINKGYHPKKWALIPNGFDIERFRPLPHNAMFRKDLGIPLSAAIIGMVARFDPMKDFATFFEAAGIALKKGNNIHFVLVGDKVDFDNPSLCRLVDEYRLTQHVHLLGRRDDVEKIYPEMDIFTLSSLWGEGFPNVIGEAMACGVPCVATDVGDSKLVIGDTGIVVPAKDPCRLADAWHSLLSAPIEKRVQLGQAARLRIVDKYRIDVIQQRYLSLYDALAGSGQDCDAEGQK